MKSEKMWNELAVYYDLIYGWKQYEKESARIHTLIRQFKKSPGNELLDVACGTGNHIRYLKKHYKVTGGDLNKEILKIAKKKLPRVRFHRINMISFDLKKRFDVITCLFSSIGYVKTYTNLRKTVDSFSRHLKPGGVLIIEPFISGDKFYSGVPFAGLVDEPDIKICRMSVTKRRGNTAILDFHFFIATPKGIERFRDKHELGLFDNDKILNILRSHGFSAKYLRRGLMEDRGLFVAVKKPW
jgi:ubiquinone/menaquinone biosynthesis C-methylase UbiE